MPKKHISSDLDSDKTKFITKYMKLQPNNSIKGICNSLEYWYSAMKVLIDSYHIYIVLYTFALVLYFYMHTCSKCGINYHLRSIKLKKS